MMRNDPIDWIFTVDRFIRTLICVSDPGGLEFVSPVTRVCFEGNSADYVPCTVQESGESLEQDYLRTHLRRHAAIHGDQPDSV